MSKTNLSMQDLFEVQRGADIVAKADEAKREDVATTQAVAQVREELAKKSKLIRWSVVQDVIFDKTVEALDIPLLTFLSPAWKKYREIQELADPEKYPPNETNLVSLAEHTVNVEHEPYLQVTYRGVAIPNAKLKFTLKGELTLQGVILRVQGGKIKAIQGGAVKGSGELLLEKKSLLKREFKSYDLTGSLELGEGIPLGNPEERVAAAAN